MDKQLYFYFYKITCLINEQYYYGVHSTYKLDDGYMGSGLRLRRCYDKYGIENYKKEILVYFKNKADMYKYEAFIVNKDLLKDPNCLNIMCGGIGNTEDHIKNPKCHGLTKEAIYKSLQTKKIRGTYKKLSNENKGYNNPEFKTLWKPIYEKDSDIICNLMINTDLPESYIIKKIFNKKVHISRLINYYKFIGKLPNEVKTETGGYRYLPTSKNIYISNITKTYYSHNITRYAIKLDDLDNRVKLLNEYVNSNMNFVEMFRNSYLKSTYLYLDNMGALTNKKEIINCIDKNNNGVIQKLHTKKLIFDIDLSKLNNIIFLDKEYNTYGINDNGRFVQKGRIF